MRLSEEEYHSGTLRTETLQFAAQKVKTDGYVVFDGILPADFVEELHAAFMAEFEAHVATHDPNRGQSRYQMHLPFHPPFCDERVVAHPLALAVIDAVLGDDCVCHYFASDTPLPGSDYQRVHSDIHPLFPESDLIVPAYGLVLNIPLVDFREDNGPVEIWPGGTHLIPGRVDLQTLAPTMTSQPCLMPAGSLLIRDLRMWHRGTPNRSDAPRPNLAMIYARHWLKTKYPPIKIAQATYEGLSERAQKLFRYEAIGG
jgi:hypothetical protein